MALGQNSGIERDRRANAAENFGSAALSPEGQSVFYVLSGVLSIEVDGEVFELNARQSLPIAAGKSHQVQNLAAESVEFLVISHPPSHGDRVTA